MIITPKELVKASHYVVANITYLHLLGDLCDDLKTTWFADVLNLSCKLFVHYSRTFYRSFEEDEYIKFICPNFAC
jgi:hypothetical protein